MTDARSFRRRLKKYGTDEQEKSHRLFGNDRDGCINRANLLWRKSEQSLTRSNPSKSKVAGWTPHTSRKLKQANPNQTSSTKQVTQNNSAIVQRFGRKSELSLKSSVVINDAMWLTCCCVCCLAAIVLVITEKARRRKPLQGTVKRADSPINKHIRETIGAHCPICDVLSIPCIHCLSYDCKQLNLFACFHIRVVIWPARAINADVL